MEKESLLELLSTGVAKIRFVKKDGTERTMKCTRDLSRIPAEFAEGSEAERKNLNVIPVYDLDAQGWRSFDFTRLLTVETI